MRYKKQLHEMSVRHSFLSCLPVMSLERFHVTIEKQ